MSTRWSLRSKLASLVIVSCLPILGLAAWDADSGLRTLEAQRAAAVTSAAELAVSRYRVVIESTRRLLPAICSEATVSKSAGPDAAPSDITGCEMYLGGVLQAFPTEYSGALVTDDKGTARCSSSMTIVGMSFADRAIFSQVRDTKTFSLGAPIASRVTGVAVIPAALPVLRGSEFGGMCAIGISLAHFANTVSSAPTGGGAAVVLVDRTGASIDSSAVTARTLPVATRVAAAIAGGRAMFTEYGQDGTLYEFGLRPLVGSTMFVIAAVPVDQSLLVLARAGSSFVLVLLALLVTLVAIWFGADRWCVRPLRYIQDFAGKVSRGDIADFAPPRPWSPELTSVGHGVTAMAAAIASREAELRAGLEQRDHMLREIHHRVKNNLQMITSLLNLQAGEIRSPRIRRYFGDAQNRVLTLSVLHRHLYERTSWALVDFQRFISDLVRQISVVDLNDNPASPRFHIRAPIMAVGPDMAIPVGLIVTEAVSAALRHDFSGVVTPEIRIEAAESDGQVTFVIEDNGLDRHGSAMRVGGRGVFGLTLIRGLASQLGGEVAVTTRDSGGTRIVVTFPMMSEQAEDA
ncbi:MAG: histidine kinase dimerization/phosphoacceptor domain -containing protein [Bauldia sp.]